MSFSSPSLLSNLERHLPTGATGKLCVALSGGLDSTVLLRALMAAPSAFSTRAIHIDHQLHDDSAKWSAHCARIAREAQVPYESAQVVVPMDSDMGVEAAARTVRYAALKEMLQPGEILLTAQHADDQLETVLLALMRGAGVNGLSAMPACRAFGGGWHVRPLLPFTRAQLEAWARAENLAWLDDPSNDNSRFSRNYLRHEVIPALRQRWPDAANSAVRSAAHLGEAGDLLAHLARADMAAASAGVCLRVDVLSQLDAARRRNVLRYWLRSLGARAPSTHKLAGLEHDMLQAQDDRTPWVAWDGFEVRRHRGLLYGGVPLPTLDAEHTELEWDMRTPLALPAGLGVLHAQPSRGVGLCPEKLPAQVRVGFRRGGETMQLAGHAHRRDLKKLLQEEGVLPWWRDRVPLLRVGRKLAAVGDLWIGEQFAARDDERGVVIVWEARPAIHAT